MDPITPRTILVIHDEGVVREQTARSLEHEGFTTATAASEEGLRVARQLRPDAITLGVRATGATRWSALQALKAEPDVAAIPVVLISAAIEPVVADALAAIADLRKAMDPAKRLDALRRMSTPSAMIREGRILLVEDDPTTRELVRLPLERLGYTVIEATNGTSALDSLDVVAPALILLNLMLPGLDAFAFMDVLRANHRWKTVPIIVMSATPSTIGNNSSQQEAPLMGESLRAADTGAAISGGSPELQDLPPLSS